MMLGDLLDQIEAQVGNLGYLTAPQAADLLFALDEAYQRLQALQNASSLPMFQGQFESITGRVRSDADLFLKNLGGLTALQPLRAERQPPEEYWWWYLDGLVQERRRASSRRIIVAVVGTALLLFALALIYHFFLAPDPAVLAQLNYEQSAQNALQSGDLNQASSDVQQSLQYAPHDPELLALQGVILEQQGKGDQARQTFLQAEQYSASREDFLMNRGQDYLLVGQYSRALADAQEIIQQNPKSANGYFLKAQANELMQNYQQAVNDYDQTFQLANEQNKAELAALARLRMGMLMQSINGANQPLSPTGTSQP